jgi:CxxC motif-containing protein (DUF1111 family)
LTRADITAAVIYQATLSVPGRIVPDDPEVGKAARIGEQRFRQIGCAVCHAGEVKPIRVDLTSDALPGPRLKPDAHGVVWVPAFTDLKLHDITSGPDDPNAEPLDQNQPASSEAFFAGNRKFITRRL